MQLPPRELFRAPAMPTLIDAIATFVLRLLAQDRFGNVPDPGSGPALRASQDSVTKDFGSAPPPLFRTIPFPSDETR